MNTGGADRLDERHIERMIPVKRIVAILAALALAMAGLMSAACAESAPVNPHAAEWLSADVAASLDTLKRVDEAGLLY